MKLFKLFRRKSKIKISVRFIPKQLTVPRKFYCGKECLELWNLEHSDIFYCDDCLMSYIKTTIPFNICLENINDYLKSGK